MLSGSVLNLVFILLNETLEEERVKEEEEEEEEIRRGPG